ncbi:DUF2264 domain-containing protein [Sphingobacterium hotanense]|uniref:DUF2264 domain-containing protein n=1 Tax=Sphingobacterium hotanense TaxID=649196 RepID=UPI0021A3A123|nr:DUF2264 domain-containing protein [Sphingobacterium hotanense]MCT1524892.1 DUF2264 domain-containing protein [Sphingobacterium hotanense]
MKHILGILILLCLFNQIGTAQEVDGLSQRQYFVATLTKIADPVLTSLSRNELKKRMPIESKYPETRKDITHLEAFARLLAGMAPWLELEDDKSPEAAIRAKYRALAVACVKNATNPDATDFMNFNRGQQPLVDAAFLAQALLRAPKQLWYQLDQGTQKNVIEALKSTRVITPGYNNWLLFSGIIEAALMEFDGSGDKMRIDYAVNQMLLWYKGDGQYGDGPNLHVDYYNSYVIQPMLIEILAVLKKHEMDRTDRYEVVLNRAKRYADIQERLIAADGSYPILGRSIAYRFGAFQLLSKIALMKALPEKTTAQQVRYALYTLIKKQVEVPGTFDQNGWLKIGFYGSQPELGESYISTGSLYLCAQAFLVLGLPPKDDFWTAANKDWTQRAAINGGKLFIDKAIAN